MNIAILGFGTIGSGVYELLQGNNDIKVKKVLDIRPVIGNVTDNIDDIANDPDIDAVVETMGGLHPTREYALKCINAGKSYVTANKLLMSECALELKRAAEESRAALLFSASCGGGIPFLYNLNKVKKTDRIKKVKGILNGTTNYILDNMFTNNLDYADALKQAQELGYAERDPSSDVDGLDTMRKLTLSCAVAFSKLPIMSDIPCYGISNISKYELEYAKNNGSIIKLIGFGAISDEGELEAYVAPALIKTGSPESSIPQNVNYISYEGDRIGEFGYLGQGAGKFPTANNIIRDLYSISDGEKSMLPGDVKLSTVSNIAKHSFYVRVPVNEPIDLPAISFKKIDNYAIIETQNLTFDELKKAVSHIKDNFVMIRED